MATETSEPGASRRRRWIVNPSFQYALVRLLVAVWIFNTALFGWFIYYLYAGPVFRLDHLVNEPDVRILSSSPPQFFFIMFLAATMGLFLVAALGVHLSHQIAGPAYRLRQSLSRVAAGDVDFEVSFRKTDYLMDLCRGFNDVLRALRGEIARDVAALKAIEASLPADAIGRRRLRELREAKEMRIAGSDPDLEVLVDGGDGGSEPSATADVLAPAAES